MKNKNKFLNPLELWRILMPHQKRYLFYVQIFVVLSIFLEISPILFIGPFVEFVISTEVAPSFLGLNHLFDYLGVTDRSTAIIISFTIFSALLVISAIFSIASIVQTTHFANFFGISISHILFERYLKRNWQELLEVRGHDTINKIVQETDRVTTGIIFPVMIIIGRLSLLFVITVILCFVNFAFTISLVLVSAMLYVVIFGMLSRTYQQNGERISRANSERYRLVMDAVNAGREIRLLKIADTILGRFFYHGESLALAKAQNISFSLIPKFIVETLAIISLLAFCVYYALYGSQTVLQSAPALLTFAVAGLKLLPILQNLFRQVSLYTSNAPAFYFIKDELQTASDLHRTKDETPPLELAGDEAATDLTVSLRDVCFHFKSEQKNVISQATFEIKAGDVVAITGPSGAGKSTLLDLIVGLLEPTAGRVLLNGCTHEEIKKATVKPVFGFAGQTPMLFHGNLLENITLRDSAKGYDKNKLENSLKRSGAWSFLSKYECNYDEVEVTASSFSGGERQRVSLARAFYSEHKILILDEPTTGLDAKTEKLVATHLMEADPEKIVIAVTHSRVLMEKANRILLVEKGHVKEISIKNVSRPLI